MASIPEENEPESLDDDEIIESGFDLFAFWDQYRQIILLVVGLIILGGVVFGVYELNQSKRTQAAETALAEAKTDDEYRQVIDKFAGTPAAGDASLLLGHKLRDEKKYDESLQVLHDFVDKNPNHPLVHAGDLSIAQTLEAAGKTDEALAKYQEVAAKYPDTYSAPVAVLEQANLLKAQGKIGEARQVYDNFQSQFPESIFSQEAMAEMHMLRTPAAAVPPKPAPGPIGVLRPPAAAPAASPVAPSATPAPTTMPVVPGAAAPR